MKGEQRDKDKDTETQRQSARWRQTGGGRGKTGWKENSKCDFAFLTWGAGRERDRETKEAKKKEGGMGEGIKGKEEEGDKRQSLAWRQAAFQYHPASYTDAHTKSTPCKWYRSTFGDFPSPKIRVDICPPPPQPTSNTEADSQIKIAGGTIQTLLPFCWECLLT